VANLSYSICPSGMLQVVQQMVGLGMPLGLSLNPFKTLLYRNITDWKPGLQQTVSICLLVKTVQLLIEKNNVKLHMLLHLFIKQLLKEASRQ